MITDEELAKLAADDIVEAVRDLIHDRMGQSERLEYHLDGLSEEEQEELLDRYEAALRKHLPPDQQ